MLGVCSGEVIVFFRVHAARFQLVGVRIPVSDLKLSNHESSSCRLPWVADQLRHCDDLIQSPGDHSAISSQQQIFWWWSVAMISIFIEKASSNRLIFYSILLTDWLSWFDLGSQHLQPGSSPGAHAKKNGGIVALWLGGGQVLFVCEFTT